MKHRVARRPASPARFVLLAVLALAGGCAPGEKTAKAPLTEHQRDSVLATEPIPGAPAVGAALDASARAATRAAGMDSTAR